MEKGKRRSFCTKGTATFFSVEKKVAKKSPRVGKGKRRSFGTKRAISLARFAFLRFSLFRHPLSPPIENCKARPQFGRALCKRFPFSFLRSAFLLLLFFSLEKKRRKSPSSLPFFDPSTSSLSSLLLSSFSRKKKEEKTYLNRVSHTVLT